MLLVPAFNGIGFWKYGSQTTCLPVEKMSRNESTSYVFANCKGAISNTINQIKRISAIDTVIPVTGRFDLVIKLRTNEPTKAYSALQKIREIKGITATQTALSFHRITSGESADSEQPLAFALVKVKGAFEGVLRRLKAFPNFLEAHVIPGEFDVVATFRGYNTEELLENSVEKISGINGITSTETLIAWNPTTQF